MDGILIAGENSNVSERLVNQVNAYLARAKSTNTIKSYRFDWVHFVNWCDGQQFVALPASPDTVMAYLTSLADHGYKASSLQRRMSSISQAHQSAGYESPTRTHRVRTLWAGIKRTHGTVQRGKKAAVLSDIRKMVDNLSNRPIDVRDRALMLVGFASALRRSELVALNFEDINVTSDGLLITLRRSKTDQDGTGRIVGVPYGSHRETCSVRAYQSWLTTSRIEHGAVFRSVDRHGNINGRLSNKAVALIVKRRAEAAGLDPSRYAGHSLRSGFATTAAAADVSERAIMRQTGHKSAAMVRRYIQEGTLFKRNAASEIGL